MHQYLLRHVLLVSVSLLLVVGCCNEPVAYYASFSVRTLYEMEELRMKLILFHSCLVKTFYALAVYR